MQMAYDSKTANARANSGLMDTNNTYVSYLSRCNNQVH